METIEINGIIINLDSKESYYEIDNFYFGDPMVKVSLEGLSKKKRERTLFLGFHSISGIKNISLLELRRLKVKGNNAVAVLKILVSQNYDYDYFFISTVCVDPIGIEFLKKIPPLFEELNKKIFIIGCVRKPIHFDVKL